MTLVKRNYNNWNSLLEDFWGSVANNHSEKELNVPPVNIQENKEAFQLDLAAPGLQKQDFKLSVNEGLFTISFEKVNSPETKVEKMHRQEFSTQSFKRTFTLDEKIDAENISAKYENGILQITLPKKEEVKVPSKEISVL
ncbi:Hsp20/alpha crystallin family protein [Arachidicoccus sp.]|uniref:Hsp20/alpha crystallin family protein n=1 Tax=Arachidicoccus sp. TaxID=1872624 RepID=UPI003D1E3084